jgi:hypothetical protein
VTRNIKGLLQALQQSINEAILDSNDVAAAMAALKRTGKCPVFTIDISMQDPPGAGTAPVDGERDMLDELVDAPSAQPTRPGRPEELVLSDMDVEFLTALGVCDPSWANTTALPVHTEPRP